MRGISAGGVENQVPMSGVDGVTTRQDEAAGEADRKAKAEIEAAS
jgi:hypothetical protein